MIITTVCTLPVTTNYNHKNNSTATYTSTTIATVTTLPPSLTLHTRELLILTISKLSNCRDCRSMLGLEYELFAVLVDQLSLCGTESVIIAEHSITAIYNLSEHSIR